MGALVGGLYAAGKLDAYTDWVENLSQFDVLRLLDVSLTDPGMIRAEKVFARVRELLAGVKIEELAVPFTAVATDLLARKPIWFQRGPVETAVRASIALPGVFTPMMLNGRVLVDGGLMDPVPVAPTASAHADVTIAVDLGGDRGASHDGAPSHETAEARPIEERAERFRPGGANLFDRDVVRSLLSRMGGTSSTEHDGQDLPATVEEQEEWPAGLGRFDVMNQSLEAMQRTLTRYRLPAISQMC